LPDGDGKSERKIAMRVLLPALTCLLLVAACSAKPEQASDTDSSGAKASTPATAAPAAAPSEPAVARSEHVSNDLYEFEYSYPAQAAAIPDLRKWLDDDLEKQRRELIEDAQEQLAERKKNDFPFNPLGDWVAWKVVTDLPNWLSLSAEVSTYEGGAHPNHGFDGMVWDRGANLRRDATDLFTSKAALSRAIRTDFCRALDRERARKRQGEDFGGDDTFTQCIDPVDSTVILGSSNHRTFDKIGILVAPYEAGPYAEGDYEVTLPVSNAVLAVVKPEYRAAFARGR
jgi:hypothetical protein